ncbi:TPA: hypothetical protein DCP13_01665 [Candidatus Azambacteria bacterium]|uniref:DUF6036 domain-containing protein n=5 Tax=Candidatus Azamiibacteriota TaxID=1752741 RepID=A0A1F5BHE6_9BACT|nr:MAG: hypothetical protein UX48_C0032G0002 [Candidatus Azambacteria bacterium GW2011_GWB1_46_27]KKU37300.1 MAG: hypothetical protein UX51_C0025G0003 [Candidatus Azambacteria bacterium GW2011_GWF2_46_32]KKU42057.1 MAG: hypothetical protein UX56_C0013G0004 [Candidatus Azambacteria bacterium GW2011_GWD2_46_48]OGD30044.1 MAG: hypothetical protein A2W60_02625 [Candidatus Azambacteria bacterium RIFCSPHIGHO2_02_46_12]OGD44178.1 MAG: hypothetical protein A3J02_01025 [Candidatus Azambacteria bacterium
MEIINPEKLLLKVAPILEALNISYFVTGGFAVSVWGRPRATFDIDIVVKLIEPKVDSLARALRKISEAGYISEYAAREAIERKSEFNFIDPETGLKVDFWITKGDEKSTMEFKRRITKKINNQEIYFISPEDLILSKLEWYKQTESSRHLEDIESTLKISKVDVKYIKKWAEKQSTLKIFENLLNKASL